MAQRITIAQLQQRVAALEAQLFLARRINEELRSSKVVAVRGPNQPHITYWVDAHGQQWAKTRLPNNRAINRKVNPI